MPEYVLLAGIALLVACLAYAAGRRAGYRDARKTVEDEAPVIVREVALREGVCPICGARAKDRPAASAVAGLLISCN